MTAAGFEHAMAEVSLVPDATVSLGEEETRKALRLVELLDATNLDIPDDFDPDG